MGLLSVARALVALTLLAVPLLVVVNLPRVLDLAGSVPVIVPTPAAVATPFRLDDTTPAAKARFAPVEIAPPPTLVPAPTPTLAPRATPGGERVVVTNTGGIGAVLRDEPVTGRAIGSLRESVEVTVLERRSMPGQGEWLRVRTSEGLEGWMLGLIARPVATSRP
jgi:hypothetical protein